MGATYEYDAYGNPLSSAGSVYSPFGYTGEYTDEESGLVYLRARYYDPSTQQFLTVDPALAWTEEAYAYVAGSPTNFTDPSGLKIPSPDSGPVRGCPGDTIDWNPPWLDCRPREWVLMQIWFQTAASAPTDITSSTDVILACGFGFAARPRSAKGSDGSGGSGNPKPVSTYRSSAPVGGKITGFTKHGLDSAMNHDGHGVHPRAMLDAVRSPVKVKPQSNGTTRYEGKDAVVVLNQSGKVVTTWATSSSGWRQ